MDIRGEYKGYPIKVTERYITVFNPDEKETELKNFTRPGEAETYIINREKRIAKGEIKKKKTVNVLLIDYSGRVRKATTKGTKAGQWSSKVWVYTEGVRTTEYNDRIFEDTPENRELAEKVQDTLELSQTLKEIGNSLRNKLTPQKFPSQE